MFLDKESQLAEFLIRVEFGGSLNFKGEEYIFIINNLQLQFSMAFLYEDSDPWIFTKACDFVAGGNSQVFPHHFTTVAWTQVDRSHLPCFRSMMLFDLLLDFVTYCFNKVCVYALSFETFLFIFSLHIIF